MTLGAHSYGQFNVELSLLEYQWTRSQERILNNQLFRQVAGKSQYFLDCRKKLGKNEFVLIGDAYGQKPNTTWSVKAHR